MCIDVIYKKTIILQKRLKVYKCSSLSHAQLFATPRTAAHQAPLSMRFSRQEYWSGLPFPSPGDLPNPRIELQSPALQADFYQLSCIYGSKLKKKKKYTLGVNWMILSILTLKN